MSYNSKFVIFVLSTVIFLQFLHAQSIDAKLGGDTESETFEVIDSNDNTLLKIQGDGDVGIGVDDPDEKLEVDGTIKATGLQLPTGATDTYVLTTDGSGNATWQARGAMGGYDDISPYGSHQTTTDGFLIIVGTDHSDPGAGYIILKIGPTSDLATNLYVNHTEYGTYPESPHLIYPIQKGLWWGLAWSGLAGAPSTNWVSIGN